MIGHYPRGADPSSLRPPACGGRAGGGRREYAGPLLVVSPRLHRRKVGGGHFGSQGGHFRRLKGQVQAFASHTYGDSAVLSQPSGIDLRKPHHLGLGGFLRSMPRFPDSPSKRLAIDVKRLANACTLPLKCYRTSSSSHGGAWPRSWQAAHSAIVVVAVVLVVESPQRERAQEATTTAWRQAARLSQMVQAGRLHPRQPGAMPGRPAHSSVSRATESSSLTKIRFPAMTGCA